MKEIKQKLDDEDVKKITHEIKQDILYTIEKYEKNLDAIKDKEVSIQQVMSLFKVQGYLQEDQLLKDETNYWIWIKHLNDLFTDPRFSPIVDYLEDNHAYKDLVANVDQVTAAEYTKRVDYAVCFVLKNVCHVDTRQTLEFLDLDGRGLWAHLKAEYGQLTVSAVAATVRSFIKESLSSTFGGEWYRFRRMFDHIWGNPDLARITAFLFWTYGGVTGNILGPFGQVTTTLTDSEKAPTPDRFNVLASQRNKVDLVDTEETDAQCTVCQGFGHKLFQCPSKFHYDFEGVRGAPYSRA